MTPQQRGIMWRHGDGGSMAQKQQQRLTGKRKAWRHQRHGNSSRRNGVKKKEVAAS